MTGLPEVSVVIPTRGRRALLPASLGSVLAQRDVELEVLVVDNGSSDGTWQFLRDHPDPRVRPLREPQVGVAPARNRGVEAARGRALAFLDDDDRWGPDKLRTQLDAMAGTGAAWSWTGVVVVDPALRPVRVQEAPAAEGILPLLISFPVSAIPAGASTVVADAALVRELGGFDPQLHHLADWDLWLRLAEAAPGIDVPDVLVAYLQHPGSMLLVESDRLLDEWEVFAAKHAALAEREGLAFDGTRFGRWVAWGQRRAGHRRAAARLYLRGALRHRSPGNVPRALGALLGERAWAPFNSLPPDRGAPLPGWLRSGGTGEPAPSGGESAR